MPLNIMRFKILTTKFLFARNPRPVVGDIRGQGIPCKGTSIMTRRSSPARGKVTALCLNFASFPKGFNCLRSGAFKGKKLETVHEKILG